MRSTFMVRTCLTALFAVSLWSQPLTLYTEISPPDQFLGPDGKLTGYAVEVVVEIQKRVGDGTPIQVVPWVRGYNEILGSTQTGLFSTVRSKERDALFQWVGPLRDKTYWFFVRKDSKIQIQSLEDAMRLPLIGVYKEDARDQFLTRMGFQNLDRSLDNLTVMKKLMAGRIDAMASADVDFTEVANLAGLHRGEFKAAFPFLQVQTYIAFSRSTPMMIVKTWNKALEEMKQDGTFERLFRKHFPDTPLPGPPRKPY